MEESVAEMERAVALRPQDYLLWLRLGYEREYARDAEGALAAYEEAVRLSPFYAQPRWYLGNLLFRTGRREEALAHLRRAARTDPRYVPAFVEIAWQESGDDAEKVRRLIEPETDEERMALARSFVARGRAADALELFRASGGASERERNLLMNALLDAGLFNQAFEVWARGRDEAKASFVTDGGFEGRIVRDEPGFSWRPARDSQTLRVSLDANGARTGAQSLRIAFNGESDPSSEIVSQLAAVEPKTRYRLTFAARTQDLVSGGLPRVVVQSAAGGEDRETLARSESFAKGTNDWRVYSLEFATDEKTSGVRIVVQREGCSSSLCPAFGFVWLDDFLLETLSANM